jgi:putative toxin-antitoxin system antitoxin component (TIGR02293 family)
MKKPYDLPIEQISYATVADNELYYLIHTTKRGVDFNLFNRIFEANPFTMNEWSGFIHVSERTLQRYRKEKRSFDQVQSEKILEIVLLMNFGAEVLGSSEKFSSWLETNNLALGKIKPKELMDSSFGIGILKDELQRIEHGLLA